jgi:hypothetical protein
MNNQKILGIYDDESKLISSIQSLQDKGFKVKDVISPYPIEKVFELLKLKTRLPAAAFIYGLLGLIGTFGFLYWTSVVNYPLVFGGKPQNTLSFVIVIFVMVIFVVVSLTLTTFFIAEKKAPGVKPSFEYPGITDDKYVIIIDKTQDLDSKTVNDLMKKEGAIEVTEQ